MSNCENHPLGCLTKDEVRGGKRRTRKHFKKSSKKGKRAMKKKGTRKRSYRKRK